VRAEATLRRAAAQSHDDPLVRQKLALVMGLQQGGRSGEAPAALPPSEANVVYLRQALAQ
jgi:Flp pilus assembly protein TadD